MKKYLLPQILFLLLFSVAFVSKNYSQTNQPTAAPTQKTDVMGENDSLPFMQNQTAVEASQPSSGGLLLKAVGAMLLIVGLLFFGAWALKKIGFDRFKQNAETDAIDLALMSTISMGGGRTISAVRFGERVLLVGSTAQNITLLADESLKDSIPAQKTTRSVADLLGEENGKSFGNEFLAAREKFDVWENNGGLPK